MSCKYERTSPCALKTKKLIVIVLITIVISALCSSCKSEKSKENGNLFFGSSSRTDMSFEDIVAAASHIMKAEYIGVAEGLGAYDYLEFKPTENIKGTPEGSPIGVVCYKGTVGSNEDTASSVDTVSGILYEPGTEYLLILNRIYSFYLDRELYIASAPATQKCISRESYNLMAEKPSDYNTLRNNQIASYEAKCAEVVLAAQANDTSSLYSACNYVRSERIDDIVSGSTYIFKVKAIEKQYEIAENNSEGYTCLVTDVLKGTPDSETIQVQFRKDSNITPEKEYLILVTKIDNSIEYYVSSKDSVFSASDTSAVSQIKGIIEDTSE